MTDNIQEDPFAVPATVSAEARSGSRDERDQKRLTDGDFVVYRKSIMFRGDLKLPPICILSGQTDNLIARHRCYLKAQFSGIGTLVLIVAVAAAVVIGLSTFWLFALAAIQAVVWRAVAPVLPRKSGYLVHLNWSISRSRAKVYRWLTYAIRTLVVCGAAFAGWSSGRDFNKQVGAAAVFFAISFALMLLFTVEPKMTVRGNKLFGINRGSRIANGHGRAFYNTFRTQQHSFSAEPQSLETREPIDERTDA